LENWPKIQWAAAWRGTSYAVRPPKKSENGLASMKFGLSQATPNLDRTMLLQGLAVFLLLHIIFSYCFMLICKKACHEPGALVWIPIAQIIPLFKAARMSPWLALLLLLPLINLAVGIVWCFKICQARKKGPLVAVLMILPLTNIPAFLYLAFADSTTVEKETLVKFKYT